METKLFINEITFDFIKVIYFQTNKKLKFQAEY